MGESKGSPFLLVFVFFKNRFQLFREVVVFKNKRDVLEKVKDNTEDLIKQCLLNDISAQNELYNRYCRAMYSTAVRMMGNNEDAKEALQDAFVRAFKHLRKFDGRVTFGAWMRKITINVCLNRLKKKNLKWIELDFEISDDHPEEPLQIDPALLNDAIEKLPSGCRTVFTLKAIEGFKHEEIAKELNISLSTSKSQFVRARKLLHLSLKKLIQI